MLGVDSCDGDDAAVVIKSGILPTVMTEAAVSLPPLLPRLVIEDDGSRENGSWLLSLESLRLSSTMASRLRASVPGENGSCTDDATEGLGTELVSASKLSSPLENLLCLVVSARRGDARLEEEEYERYRGQKGGSAAESLRRTMHSQPDGRSGVAGDIERAAVRLSW